MDICDRIAVLLAGLLLTALLLIVIAGCVVSVDTVMTSCQRTDDTRPGVDTIVITGDTIAYVSSTERRYICENGDRWL